MASVRIWVSALMPILSEGNAAGTMRRDGVADAVWECRSDGWKVSRQMSGETVMLRAAQSRLGMVLGLSGG
jgi:hypothetical protein